jgi:hypothetical protein
VVLFLRRSSWMNIPRMSRLSKLVRFSKARVSTLTRVSRQRMSRSSELTNSPDLPMERDTHSNDLAQEIEMVNILKQRSVSNSATLNAISDGRMYTMVWLISRL